MPNFNILPLEKGCDRSTFDCGEPELNEFLKTKARQNQTDGFNRTFIAVHASDKKKKVLGYYCLSVASISLEILPAARRSKLPKHPVPCVCIGRLAVDNSVKGQGLGQTLLVDALKRIKKVSQDAGVYAVIVDAKNTPAVTFYKKYGFESFEIDQKRLFLPVANIP